MKSSLFTKVGRSANKEALRVAFRPGNYPPLDWLGASCTPRPLPPFAKYTSLIRPVARLLSRCITVFLSGRLISLTAFARAVFARTHTHTRASADDFHLHRCRYTAVKPTRIYCRRYCSSEANYARGGCGWLLVVLSEAILIECPLSPSFTPPFASVSLSACSEEVRARTIVMPRVREWEGERDETEKFDDSVLW